MPDILDASGLTISTFTELRDNHVEGMQEIYGSDINVDQNSPDGQSININAQAGIDVRELAAAVYNSFNPDRAIGSTLDERVAINNISRNGGTFTVQPVDLVISQTVSLPGLDGEAANVDGAGFTVQDGAGNKFILFDSETFTPGTYSRNFRAQKLGQVETTVNTITIPVTVYLGVTSVNNSTGAIQTGQNEETDAQLRLRHQRSVALASAGYLNGLLGLVLALPGVTDAKLYENFTDSVDVNGIPAHGMWLVVEGGASDAIAEVIYRKKSYGANMKGAVVVNITTASGSVFPARFDRPSPENLYVRFYIKPTINTAVFDQAFIKQYIVDNITYSIGQFAEVSALYAVALAAINANGGGGVPYDLEISRDGVTYVDYLDTTTLDRQFVLDASRITITVM